MQTLARRLVTLLTLVPVGAAAAVAVPTAAHALPTGCSAYRAQHPQEVRASCGGGFGWVIVGAICVTKKPGQDPIEFRMYGNWAYVEFGEVSVLRCGNRPPEDFWYEVADD
jgi:hypothetical protein